MVDLVRDKLESTNGVEFFATAGEHGLLRLWGWRKVSSGGKDGASPKLKAKCLLDASVLADAAVVRGATKKDEHGVETRPTWAQFGGLLWRPAAASASQQQQQSGSPSGQLVAHTLDHSFVFVEPATMKADKLVRGVALGQPKRRTTLTSGSFLRLTHRLLVTMMRSLTWLMCP